MKISLYPWHRGMTGGLAMLTKGETGETSFFTGQSSPPGMKNGNILPRLGFFLLAGISLAIVMIRPDQF